MPTHDFVGAVPLDPFRALVPVPDDAMQIKSDNCVVSDAFDQQLVTLLGLCQYFGNLLALLDFRGRCRRLAGL
jgi:hypothetical protein